MTLCILCVLSFFFTFYVLIYAYVFPDAAEVDQVAGSRTRKNIQRNVRSKRPVISSREGPARGSAEPIKAEQRLSQSGDSSKSSSRQTNSESERTVTSSNTGSSDPHLMETSMKNTDNAVIANKDTEIRPVNNDCGSTDNVEDTNFDLDDQTIMTYVFQYSYCSIWFMSSLSDASCAQNLKDN